MIKSRRWKGKDLHVAPSLGIAFVVLGVLLFTVTILFPQKNNILLFAGLFFVLAGIAGYVYALKRGRN